MASFRAVISGRVQMVMYRDFAVRAARALGIVGTVRNLDGGSVEVIAEGEKAMLEAYLKKLKRGSMLSNVDGIEVEWREPTGRFEDFAIQF